MGCGGWSSWHFLAALFDDGVPVPDGPGVYAIRRAPNGNPQAICRAFRSDPDGILCYGSGKLKDRIGGFYEAAFCGARPGHAEGERYHKLRYAGNGYPLRALQVRWRKCDTRQDAYDAEAALLMSYAKRYGETPPLNRQVPARNDP